jgi:2,4-dienoyl-CoA reductase (NADPH2)
MTVRNRVVMSPMVAPRGDRRLYTAWGLGPLSHSQRREGGRKTEHMDRLDRLGVAVHVRAAVEQITTEAVVFTPAAGTARELAADSVVIAGTVEPDPTLFDTLVAALPGADVHAAGDCTGLGLIRKATEDGPRAACAL